MKTIVKTKREYARLVANLDGKNQGLSQREAEKVFKLAFALDVAARKAGFKSPLEMVKKKAIKKAKGLKVKA